MQLMKKYLFIFLLHLRVSRFFTAITFYNYDHSILECINKIPNNYYSDHILIISTLPARHFNLKLNFNGTTTLFFNTISVPRRHWKFSSFLFLVYNMFDIKLIFNKIYKTEQWNSRGNFIIGYFGTENLDEIFKIAWEYFVYNIDVISLNEKNETNIYTYFPYKDNSCGDYKDYDIICECDVNDMTNLFPSKIPLNLNECPIRLMAYPMIPYVINIHANREKAAKAGIEITIIHVLSQRMNFYEMYVPHNHSFWGFKDLNGVYQFMFGSLYRNECDLTLGMQFGNASHVIDFDGGFVHLIDASVWWVPIALPIAQWKNLTTIFDKYVWIAILLLFAVNGCAWWVIGRHKESAHDYNEIVLSLMSSLYSLLQGSVAAPNTEILRFTFIIWLFSCLLIFTAYQSQLVSILTSPAYDHQIQSMEEVVNSTLGYGMFVGAALAFQDPTNWVHMKIMKNYFQCPLSNYCMNRTAFERDFVASRNLRNSRYFIPRFYTGSTGQILIYPLEYDRLGIWIRFYMTKGFPLLDRINNLVMLMESNGLISKWDSDIAFYILKGQSEPDHKPLTVEHLQGAFFILSFGLTFTVFIFLCELFRYSINVIKKRTRKCNKN